MNLLGSAVIAGLLVAVWGQVNVLLPACDSPDVEEAAIAAQDYLNAQHTHGYKYTLNRVEDVKIHTKPDGDNTYVLEVDLLETDCHVMDPTPLVNCTVRPKHLTAVEGDCDVALKKVNGAFTVTAFKCKTEESTEDMCLGCPKLLPLNDTMGLEFVQATLGTVNNMTESDKFVLLEVGRISLQIVSGGPFLMAEFVVSGANCTVDPCVPMNDVNTARGICTAKGSLSQHAVDCKIFPTLLPVVEPNSTATVNPLPLPAVHMHRENMSHKHGLRLHKLTTFHDPGSSGFVSAESGESDEIVPVAPAVAVPAAADPAPAAADPAPAAADPAPAAADPAPAAADPAPAAADPAPAAADPAPAAADPAPVAADSGSTSDSSRSAEISHILFKRNVPVVPVPIMADATVAQAPPIQPVQLCPGKIRYF